MTTAIYIHDIESDSKLETVLNEVFDRVVSIAFHKDFDDIIKNIEDSANFAIKEHKSSVIFLVASSFAGIYADKISRDHNLPVILINPIVELAKNVELDTLTNGGKLILLAEDDEVVDYKKAKSFYQKHGKIVVEKTGRHRFDNKRLKKHIEEFLTETYW